LLTKTKLNSEICKCTLIPFFTLYNSYTRVDKSNKKKMNNLKIIALLLNECKNKKKCKKMRGGNIYAHRSL